MKTGDSTNNINDDLYYTLTNLLAVIKNQTASVYELMEDRNLTIKRREEMIRDLLFQVDSIVDVLTDKIGEAAEIIH
jgi:hypothetical protein